MNLPEYHRAVSAAVLAFRQDVADATDRLEKNLAVTRAEFFEEQDKVERPERGLS